ncbi:F0F1 ATP synthase subunit A [Lactobacillus sp. CC-MHH1034]|uniref:F0F1 ATP synthase subunit A n=1 Tax=Agrilactobacillus fermenti TaxID=2586909 RepID=UPI001E55E233|nr:F0F1 ATP synthase subunit A [Agrilactobacillus fermenti]MCD2256434.1 F0F1 ATP synthase subunit A [Agrilactobacillus fermenti]
MEDKIPTFTIAGLNFNLGNDISGVIAALMVLGFVFFLAKNPKIRPSKRQNILEWLIDFVNNIVKGSIPGEEGRKFYGLAFVMFLFIFMSNQLGLFLQVNVGDYNFVKSPTASPVITMTLAMIILLLSHYYGVKKWGFGTYLKNYSRPVAFLTPVNVLEEFTNFLTLSLRLFGNIYAGEILLKLIATFMKSHGVITFIPGIFLEMVWQAFSVFIGSIQAYVFVTLSMVYISKKLEQE